MKECTHCKITQGLGDFYLQNGRPKSWCKKCTRELERSAYASDPDKYKKRALLHRSLNKESCNARRREYYKANSEKLKMKAREVRSRDRAAYNQAARAKRLLNPQKYRDQARAVRRLNPGRERKYHLKSNYRLTIELFDSMVLSQNNSCAICRTDFDKRKPHVDHCHNTGVVRGILCTQCNTGIGYFGDNPALMISASEYINNANRSRP